jgi:hypothetical protein
VRTWLGTAGLMVLLALGGRALWIELSRYELREVPPSEARAVLPTGVRVLVSRTSVGRLAVGDVIDFRHPLTPHTALYLRVASIAPSRASSGYAVTLETGAPGADAWHAELHGAVWRVVARWDGGIVSGGAR